MSNFYIDVPKPEVKDQWLKMWPAYADEEETPSLNTLEEIWQRIMNTDQPTHAFFAYDNQDKLIGFLHYIIHQTTWSISNRCYMQDVYVIPNFRRKGVFNKLYKALQKLGEEEKWDKIYWVTRPNNQAGQAAYEKITQKTNWIRYDHNLQKDAKT